MTAPSPIHSIDARGIHLSVELLENIAAGLDEVAVGEALAVAADDFEAIDTDLRSWSKVTGHEVVAANPTDGAISYVIVKGPPMPTAHKMVVVVSSDRPHEMASPLGLARAAVLEGLEVSVFFRAEGVRVLSRFYNPRQRFGWLRGNRRLPHPHGDVFRLFDHGAHVYACGMSMEENGMTPGDLLFDNIMVAEYATMVAAMSEADVTIGS